MTGLQPQLEYYRVSVACSDTGQILAIDSDDGPVLPVISIPRWSRTVREVQAKLEELFGITIVVIEIFESRGSTGFVFAEMFRGNQPPRSRGFRPINLDTLQDGELTGDQRLAILSLMERGLSRGPFFRSGWLEDAVDWIRHVTGQSGGPFEIVQFNASALTALVRVRFAGSTYWLKAVAPELNSEYRFTKELVRLFPNFLPKMVSSRDDWHAFLMRSSGLALGHNRQCTLDNVGIVGRSLAELQLSTIQHAETLLALGFSDVRVRGIGLQIHTALPIMERAMSAENFTGAARFPLKKLSEICIEVEELCSFLDHLMVPNTLVHDDLHAQNILIENRQCVFIDWAHPAVGNPLLAYNQLSADFLHRPRLHACLSATYQAVLKRIISPHQINRTLAVLPAFGAAVELQQCLLQAGTSARHERHLARRIRNLTRYLERVLREAATAQQRRPA